MYTLTFKGKTVSSENYNAAEISRERIQEWIDSISARFQAEIDWKKWNHKEISKPYWITSGNTFVFASCEYKRSTDDVRIEIYITRITEEIDFYQKLRRETLKES